MIILTNCLSRLDDEGGIKVAQKLVTGIRQYCAETKLYTYEGEYSQSDRHLKLNKLMLNLQLVSLLRKSKENLLYAPQFARMLPMALRVMVLSCYSRGSVHVLLPMCFKPSKLARMLLKISGAKLYVLSHDAWEMMRCETENRVSYIKAGVDTKKFHPVDLEKKKQLRQKYGFAEDQKIVLHVGHLTAGRNVATMLNLNRQYQAVLVTSTQKEEFWDADLNARMKSDETSIRLVDTYLPNVEEMYQLSDVYFFPVLMAGRCIDSPLSVLEAAACDLPVVTTAFGEVKQLAGRDGIYILDSLGESHVDNMIGKALDQSIGARNSVAEYDWQFAIKRMIELIDGEDAK